MGFSRPLKNAVRDLYEALLAGVSSSFDTLAEIATDLGLKALKTTTMTAAGLVTGGGDLSANRTFTVTAASAAEALAMSVTDRALTPSNLADFGALRLLGCSAVPLSHTGDTSQTTLATVSVPANFLGANGLIIIIPLWSVTNNANTKTLRVKFGATEFLNATPLASVATHQSIIVIRNRGATNSQVGAQANFAGIGSSTAGVVTAAIDTTAAVDITLTVQLGTGTDTATLEGYLILALKKA